MQSPFFPNLFFGWAFVLILLGFTATSTILDWRTTLVRNKLTLSFLGVGVILTLVRCAWLGYSGNPLWAFSSSSLWYGVFDGLLFALAGFFLAFSIMFVHWILGTCGGGDVKLISAVGVWLGPKLLFMSYAATIIVLLVLIVLKVFAGGIGVGNIQKTLKKDKKVKPGKMRLTYSFPVAVATLAVLLWYCRVDLRLVPPQDDNPRAQLHVR